MTSKDSIVVVGAGFVGLATATFLAVKRHKVIAVDKNPYTVEGLSRGQLHFHEPLLARKLKAVIKSGHLTVSAPTRQHYEKASLIIVAIDSADQNTWHMKLTAFERMAAWIGGVPRRKRCLVALKSTNVLGLAERFRELLDRMPHGDRVDLVVNPEFLREGHAYEDTARPWRVVIGAREPQASAKLVRLYRTLYAKSTPIITTDWRSAELIKLAANLYLSHRLAFINEIAQYAHIEGLDIEKIKEGIGHDPRIGRGYFEPGLGFGGSCLPKDCHLINSRETGQKFVFQTAETALAVNDCVLDTLIEDLRKKLGSFKGKKIAILGIAFKPETDDTRGSQAVKLAIKLKRRGARLAIHDPYLVGAEKVFEGNLSLQDDLKETLRGASAIVIGTAHEGFLRLRPAMVASLVRGKTVADRFRILNRQTWMKHGFVFI